MCSAGMQDLGGGKNTRFTCEVWSVSAKLTDRSACDLIDNTASRSQGRRYQLDLKKH